MDQTERNIAIIKQRIDEQVAKLRKDLDAWIAERSGPNMAEAPDGKFRGPYVAITAALLETAIDRMLALHGGPDTREFILKAFDRRLAVYKRSLQ